MNKFLFTGRLGRDSELKNVNGKTLLSFNVAVDSGFGDKKTTNWVQCNLWGKRAESLNPYLKKGIKIFGMGELTHREFEHKGEKRSSVDVLIDNVELMGEKGLTESSKEFVNAYENEELKSDIPF